MAQTVILEEQTLTGFSYNDNYGAYILNVNPAPFTLIEGESYAVTWDGKEYICTAQTIDGQTGLVIGNAASLGGKGNGEPFAIGWVEVGVSYFAVDAETSHTVAIYGVTARTNVLGTLFGNIADAIRTKTGETGTMKPAEFAEKIAGIAVDGSGGAVVYWVTFMNGDAELFKMPVLAGDDCKDPLATGDIARPTKESTVSQVFAYSGWSPTDGGSADSTLLKAVTGDKTVWAAYTATARTYTVRFYDGETLLYTQSVAYGGSSAYTYDKEGCIFNGWTPKPVNVTTDLDCYGKWTEKPNFATSTWEAIAQICESGLASDTFALGDTRTITLTLPNGTIQMGIQIVGFNHDDLSDGSGKAGISVISMPCVYWADFNDYDSNITSSFMYDVTKNHGCWGASTLRPLCNEYIYSYLPAELQQCIKEVTKNSWDSTNTLIDTNDKVWVPSIYELCDTRTYARGEDGTQYEYMSTAARRIKNDLSGTATLYGSRTPSTYNDNFTNCIGTRGDYNGRASANGRFAFGFCI